jgi:hypothetical protein
MPEIISAKCLGCGNVIKVPAALGGKKARCPQCTNTIVIPTAASDTQFTDIISDEQLPEVAREGEIMRPRKATRHPRTAIPKSRRGHPESGAAAAPASAAASPARRPRAPRASSAAAPSPLPETGGTASRKPPQGGSTWA